MWEKRAFTKVVPVEYKKGNQRQMIQIFSSGGAALCLEEMLCWTIPYGYIYYGEVRRRIKIEFTTGSAGRK